jgi:hypothetical protein
MTLKETPVIDLIFYKAITFKNFEIIIKILYFNISGIGLPL